MRSIPSLIYHLGRYWIWWGLKDRRGHYILECLQEEGTGRIAPPDKCRLVKGEGYTRQMEGIRYFQALRGW